MAFIQSEKKISRRKLLAGAGKIAAGAAGIALMSSGELNLISPAYAKNTTFPWGYKKLDPVKTGNIAYENFYKSFCCYGVASSIILQLQEVMGEPYTLFPLEVTIWGHGGAVGWGTLCGALNGVGTTTSLIAGREGEKILNDVIAWYAKTALPIYNPPKPRANIKQASKSDSALCHISVGKWLRKERVKFGSPEQAERCGRLTADVAMKTVGLLNDWADGKYKPANNESQVQLYQIPTENKCSSCHGDNGPSSDGFTYKGCSE